MLDAETVTWNPATTATDDYGNVTATAGRARTLQAMFATRTDIELQDPNSPAVNLTKSLYLFDTSVVPGSSDQFVIRGETYDVVGEAHRWGSMGVEVIVQRSEGRA